jgi:hypothetical protein
MHRATSGNTMRAFKQRHLTSAELAKSEATPGYSGDGLSMFTHQAARSKQTRKIVEAKPRSVRDIIRVEEHKLRKLYAKHKTMTEDDPRIHTVRKNIDIAQTFIAKLYAELGADINRGKA